MEHKYGGEDCETHDHGHKHGDGAGIKSAQGRLAFSILFTLLFVVGETVAGLTSGSLALLSDAGHNFADALALALSAAALWIAKRPANSGQTYGYHRVGILVALVNAVSLVVIALGIFWEAVERFRHPHPVDSTLMIWVAAVALVLNAAISISLHRGSKENLNLKSAYLHMLGDAIASIGVVVAGFLIKATGWQMADSVVSMAIGALILWSSWGILKESVNVLLEAAPKGLDMVALEETIRTMPGVLSVHDLHVWTVASGMISCSCHILIAEQTVASGEQVLRALAERLKQGYKIAHSTIQIEVEGCEPDEMYCTMRALGGSSHAAHSH